MKPRCAGLRHIAQSPAAHLCQPCAPGSNRCVPADRESATSLPWAAVQIWGCRLCRPLASLTCRAATSRWLRASGSIPWRLDRAGTGGRCLFPAPNECWFDCGDGRCVDCVDEDEPNHPRHQPNAAAQISITTSAPTRASFSARRKTRRATNRKTATTTKTISPVVMVASTVLTYCLLPSVFCLR